MKETIKNSLETLVYILESNLDKNLIQEIELNDIKYYEKYNAFDTTITIKSFCEDPDVGVFNSITDDVDTALYKIIKQYDLSSNGKLKKVDKSVGSYLMVLFVGCKWENSADSSLYMTYHLMQDEYSDNE